MHHFKTEVFYIKFLCFFHFAYRNPQMLYPFDIIAQFHKVTSIII